MSAGKPLEDRPMLGLGLMCLALFLFTGIDSSAKWLILSGLPVIQVVFVRYAGHFLTSLAIFVPREGLDVFRSNAPRLQLMRAGVLLASTVFNFAALKYLPITVTTAIQFASPIIITLMSVAFLGERIGGRRVAAILTGFVGVLIVVQPWGAAFHWSMIFSLGGLLCASAYFVLTRRLAGVEANSTSQIWASGIATLALAPFGLSVWTWPADAVDWVPFLLIGMFGASGHSFAVAAHRFAPASTLAPMTYVQAVYATASGYLLFGNLPTWATALGTAIIVGSGIYIWNRERALMLERRRVEAAALTR